jgi:hypothetical protein
MLRSARLANAVAKYRKTSMFYHPVSVNGSIVQNMWITSCLPFKM